MNRCARSANVLSRHGFISMAAAVLGLTAACGGDRDPQAPRAARDSAGVRIVTHGAGAVESAQEWSVPATPVLVVGDETGGVSFDGIRGVLGLPEGRWAVLDGTDQIRVVDDRGVLETSIGGRGEGPGEFRFAASMRSGGGDTIGVWDPVAHRLSWFEVDAGLLEEAPISRERLSSLVGGAGISEAMLALSSRYLLMASQGRPTEPAPGEIFRPAIDIAVVDRDEARLHPLGRWGDTERTVVETARGPVSLPILNPRGFAVAASPTSPVICVGDQAAPIVTCLDPRNERRWSIRWEAEPREISQTARARLEDEFRDATARRFPPEVMNQILADLPVGAALPAFESLLLDAEDRLWVLGTGGKVAEGDANMALVFDSRGDVLGRVRLPPIQEALYADSAFLAGVSRGELGIEALEVFRIAGGR